jgi:hypothetical protein
VSDLWNRQHPLTWILLNACFLLLGRWASAQNNSPGWIGAPLVGLVTNQEMTEVRAIQGVPGSSTVSDPIALPVGVLRVHLAPGQGWALVENGSAHSLSILPFNGIEPRDAIPIGDAMSAPDLVSFSPSGRSAVIVWKAAAALQVLSGLDGVPRLMMQTGISSLGEIGAAAVSDDGTRASALMKDGHIFLLSPTQSPQLIFQADSPAGMSFLPDQQTVAIADGGAGTVSVIDGLNGVPFPRVVMPGPNLSGDAVLVQPSGDARSLFLAAHGGAVAYRVDLADRNVQSLIVPAKFSVLERLRGRDLFLFRASPGEAAWLLLFDGENLSAGFAQSADRREPRGVPRTGSPNAR